MAGDMTTPVTAYLQLVPKIKTDDIHKEVGEPVAEEGEKAGSSFGKKFIKAFAALGVGAAIVGTMRKAFDAFAEYEQLAGGADLLWGDAYENIAQYAAEAYKTIGMSQNDYLAQVNGFAVGFKNALGGDEQAAAELANRVMNAQADVVAATGVSLDMVQSAFSGVMRHNYTMLDNLGLGIDATIEGVEKMIDQVNAWNAAQGNATHYTEENVADVQAALVDYIDMQGLAGYASMEGASTITGSIARTQAAWSNMLSGMAQDGADIEALTGQLVESVVGSAQLIIPRVLSILQGLFAALPTAIEQLTPALMEFLQQFISDLPGILEAGMTCITKLIEGVSAALPDLMVTFVDAVVQIAEVLTKPENLVPLLNAAMMFINEMLRGIFLALPELLGSVPDIVDSIVSSFFEFLPEFVQMGIQICAGIAAGIWQAATQVVNALWGVLKNAWNNAKDFLGIHSPSRLFADMGVQIPAGLGVGIDNGADTAVQSVRRMVGDVQSAASSSINDMSSSSVTINASINASSLADVSTVQQLFERLNATREAQQVRISRMGASYGY